MCYYEYCAYKCHDRDGVDLQMGAYVNTGEEEGGIHTLNVGMHPFYNMLSDSPPVDFYIEEVILFSVFRHKLPGLKRAVVIDVPAARPPFPPAAFHALSNLAACAACTKVLPRIRGCRGGHGMRLF
jgi:hypothetical protein